jgi:hypothetical protein
VARGYRPTGEDDYAPTRAPGLRQPTAGRGRREVTDGRLLSEKGLNVGTRRKPTAPTSLCRPLLGLRGLVYPAGKRPHRPCNPVRTPSHRPVIRTIKDLARFAANASRRPLAARWYPQGSRQPTYPPRNSRRLHRPITRSRPLCHSSPRFSTRGCRDSVSPVVAERRDFRGLTRQTSPHYFVMTNRLSSPIV